MNEFVVLNQRDLEHLIFTIETSLKVNKRFQFFLWAQGALQEFIPHETLLCAYGDIDQLKFSHEIFSKVQLSKQVEKEMGEPIDGVLPRLIGKWLRNGRNPYLLNSEQTSSDVRGSCDGKADFALSSYMYNHVVAHGAKEILGEFGSFFAFLSLPVPPGPRESYIVEMLMPYLHMALHRMLANEKLSGDQEAVLDSVLSKREIQVLQWVRDGKTNQEIGQILDISPLTVKNHVQKILRKLNVNNRTQAVVKGVAARLLPSEQAS